MDAWAVAPDIRWLERVVSQEPLYRTERVLQQAWVNQRTGEVEWKDVEIVKDEK